MRKIAALYLFVRNTRKISSVRASSSFLNTSKKIACFSKNLRTYCSLPACVWPSSLPPATEWGYSIRKGPETWSAKYPEAGGQHQSPVEISASTARPHAFDSPLAWRYGECVAKSIVNTGCGWRVDAHGPDSELSGGPLSESYELVQFHCHWADENSLGSEHIVDGQCYAGELHFVHWNKEKYASCAEAVKSPNGLAVIGVFLEIGEKNSEIEKLCDIIPKIVLKDERITLQSEVSPTGMFPDAFAYWTYSGSLTTPPCYESVTWIVFKKPISISVEQLNCFRAMKKACESGAEPECVHKNFRPPQPLHDREILDCA